MLRRRAGANSLRKMAVSKPIGTATTMATSATTMVPLTSGRTPKLLEAKRGVQRVPVRKSTIGTSPKNWMVSPRRVMTIPVVVRMEMTAQRNSTA